MLFLMMCYPNFDKMLEKYVLSKDLPYIKESVKSLRQKVCERNVFINNFKANKVPERYRVRIILQLFLF